MKTRITSFLVVLCCTFALRAQAQNEVIVDSLITDEASGTISNAMMSFGSGYLWARGDFGERPGSDDSFATFGGFGGVYLFGPNEFAFADGRVWVTDNSRVGGEMGIGNRWIGDRVAFGINSFLTYDTGQMAQDSNHTRISVGGEILMDYFSLTANGYLPLNDDPRRFGPMMLVDKLTLLGNNAVFQNLQMAEQQMQGVDFELSAQIPRAEWLTVAGGGYHFEANDGGDAVNGVVGRVGVDLTSVLFDVSIQDDDRFGTTLNVGGEVRLGSGPPALIPRYRNLQTKIVERVRHRSRVALNQFLVTDNELAINPATGLPFTFINVDNTAAPGGDGSFENRFNDLGLANGPDGDIILVWRGDSSAINTTPNTGGLFLDDNQQIYGQGTNLFLQTLNRVAPSEICEFTDIGTNPFVDAPINLANNNLVQGLNIITAPGMNAIGGTNSSNFQILDINQDMGAGNTGPGGGIVLNNATGTGLISNFQYRTANPAAPGGIVINNVNAADLDLIIEDAPVIEGGAAGIALLADNSDIEAMITNVQATGNVDGLVLGAANGGNVDATVASSSFNDAIANGAEIDVTTGGNVDLVAVDTDFMGAGVDAINANLDNGTGSITLSNSSLEGAMDDAFDLTLANGADFDQMFNLVTGNGVGDDGVVVNATGGSTYNGVIANSTFDGVGTGMFGDGNAFELDFDGSDGMLTLLNTSGAMADNDAIQLEGTNSSTIGLMLDNSTMFSGPGGDGLDILNMDSTVMVLADSTPDTPVDFSGAMGNGVVTNTSGVADTTVMFMDGANLNNAGLDAINATSTAGGVTTIAGTNMTGNMAGQDGLDLTASTGGVIDIDFTGVNDFSGATDNGILSMNTMGGTVDVNIAAADFSGAGIDGLFSSADGMNSTSTFTFNTGANFNGAGDDAIDFESTAGGVNNLIGMNLTGTMVGATTGDTGNAFELTTTGMDSETNITLTGTNDFSEALDNGILSNNTDGTVVVTIDDADFSGAVNGDGLDSTATGATATSTFNFNMGAMFDDAAMGNAIILSSQMGATTDFNGDGISGTNAFLDAINLTANGMGSDVQFDIVNSTDFFNSGEDGLDFTVDNMANMDINIAGAMGAPVNFDDLENGSLVQGGHGVLGNIDNMSTATLMLNFTSFNDAAIDGLDVMAAADSTFTGTISNSTFNNALVDGLSVDMDGSTGVLNLTNVDANNAGDNGLMLRADDTMAVGSSTLDVNLNTVNLNMAMGDAINAIAMDGGYIDIDGVDVNGQGATDMGIQLSADASQIDLTLTASNPLMPNNFTNSGDSGLVFNGMNGSTLNVNVSDTNFDDTTPGGFGINGSLTDSMATLNLTDVSANNAEFAGLRIRADNSTVMGTLDTVSLDDAGTDAIFVQGLNAADVDLTMDAISGLRAGDDGFDIVATGNMTDINVQIDNSDFSDATNNGLEVDFRDFSNVVFNSDMNLSLNNAGQSAAIAGMGDAINLFGDTNATADIDVTSGSLLNAFDDMTDAVMIMGGATGSVLIDPTPATGAGDNGLEFEVASGGTFNFFMGDPGGAVDPDSPISTIADPVGNNGVLGTIDNGTVNLTFTNSDINTDGTSAGDGINVTGTNASDFNLTLTNSDVMGWSNGNGIIVDMTDSDATLNLNGADLSGAGMDALNVASNGTSVVDVNLGAAGMTINNTGGTAINALADGGTINVNADGGLIVNTTGGDGVALTSDNSGTIVFDDSMNGLTIDGAGATGLNLQADGASMITVTAMDAFIQNSGGNGISAIANEDSTINVTLRDGAIQNNGMDPMLQPGHGIYAVTNDIGDMMDGSLITFDLMSIDILENMGDGLSLEANMGNNTSTMVPLSSGISYMHNGGTIANNNLAPLDTVDGWGIDAVANGGGMAGDTLINLELTDVTVLGQPQPPGNEEGALNLNTNNGGGIIQNITGGQLDGPVVVCADGSLSFASVSLDNVLINPSVDAAAIVLCAINDGQVFGDFSNLTGATALTGHGAQAVAFLADTGGQIDANFTNVQMHDNLQNIGTLTGPLPAGHPDEPTFTAAGFGIESVVQGLVTGSGAMASSANVTFTDVEIFDNAGANAFQVDVENGGQFDLTIADSLGDMDVLGMTTFNNGSMSGEGEFEINVDGAGSLATLDIDGLSVNDLGGIGVNLVGTNDGAFNIERLNNITANNAAETGFNLVGTLDTADDTVSLTNSFFNNAAGGDGVNIDLDVAANTTVTLDNVEANNAFGNGVNVILDANSNVAVFDLDVTLNDVQADMAGGNRGLLINIAGLASGANSDVSITGGSSFNDAADDGINIVFEGATDSTATVTIQDTTATGAQGTNPGFGDGIYIANNAQTDITGITISNGMVMSGVDVSGAADNGLQIVLDDQASPTVIDTVIDISDLTANDTDALAIDIAGTNMQGAISISLTDVTADNTMMGTGGGIAISLDSAAGFGANQTISLDNVSAQNAAGVDGLNIAVTDLLGTDEVMIDIINMSDFSGADMDGINIDVEGTGLATVNISDTMANNAGDTGVDINLGQVGGPIAHGSSVTVNNVIATGAMTGSGLDIVADVAAGGTFDVTVGGGSDFSNTVMADGVNIDINGGNTVNLSVDGLTSSNNGVADGLDGNGNGFVFTTDPMVLVNINDFANLTTNNNDGAGIELNFDNTTVNFDANMTGVVFENITSTMNQTNGLAFNFDNTTTKYQGVDAGMPGGTVIIDGLVLSNNGQAGSAFDGLDFSADNSDVAFRFNNLTIDGSGGRAIDLDVTNSSNVIFDVVNTGQSFDGSGLEGMDIDVDNSSLTSTFMGIDILNSGAFPTIEADGVNVLVSNMATVDLTFDDVTSDGSDQDGFDIDLTAGTTGTITVQNGTTGSGNGDGTNGIGFALTATDADLTLNMDGSMNPNMFNMNDEEGVLIDLNGMTMVNNLSVDVTANQNTSDGVRIEVDPNVNFTPAGGTINANRVVANNNTGSGLVIDVDSNPTITAFGLTGAAFTGNAVDQVYLGFTSMALTSLNINDVDVTGTATSEDGIEINLVDTTVTNLNVFDLVAMNNGENGLNLFLDETMRTNTMTESSIGNLKIEQSMFSGNSALYNRGDANPANDNFAAILITQRGESTIDADLFDNTINANSGIGINVRVQDGDLNANMNPGFTIENTNTANSFYNNTITSNGGFGFLLTASEPLDLTPIPADNVGPTYTLDLGVAGFNPNTITGNADAAVAVNGQGDSSGTFNIVNSILSGTTDGADMDFDGDGLAILLEDNAALTNLTAMGAGVLLNGNAGSGLVTDLRDSSTLTTYLVDGVTIQNNMEHGIDVVRSDMGAYTNGIVIQNSTLQSNTLNGVNIVNNNDPLQPPLMVNVNNNMLISNMQDGVSLTGQGDAITIGSVNDNTFTGQGRDGIHVQLDNTAQLGNSTQALNTGMFNLLGNVVTGSGRDGVHLDVNRTTGDVVAGFPGNAFINVVIDDSLTNQSAITNSGRHGINILDDSSFTQMMNVVQNTYRIQHVEVSNNSVDGLHVEQRTISPPFLPQTQGGIDLRLLGDVGTLDLIFANNGDDGIDIDMRSAAVGTGGVNDRSNVVLINGLQVLNSGAGSATGHGIEFTFDDSSSAAQAGGATVNFLQQNPTNAAMPFDAMTTGGRSVINGMDNGGGDGIHIEVLSDNNVAGNQIVVVNMDGVESTRNGGRGLYAFVERNNPNSSDVSVFNIGDPTVNNNFPNPPAGVAPNPSNIFSNNGLSGVVFDIQADAGALSQNTTTGNAGSRSDNNPDVEVRVNLDTNNGGSGTYVSSQHPYANGINTLASFMETAIHGETTIQFYNNELENNNVDGLDLSVGTLMRMNAAVAGNRFNGNQGNFDIRIFPVRSNGMNPPDSQNAASGTADDYFVFDPVSYLDLVLGTIDSNQDGVFGPTDNVAANFGQAFNLSDTGTTVTSAITADGVFTNAGDPFKPTNRPVRLMGQIRVNVNNGDPTGPFALGGVNPDWQESFVDTLNMTIQNINSQFNNFVTDGNGVPFPEGFPYFP